MVAASRALLLFALSAVLSFVSGVEPGYVGVDIPGPDIASLTGVTSALDCALACDANANCKAWIWAYPGSGCSANNANKCWLKSASGLGTRFATPCRELGFRQGESGVDRVGGDLPGMPLVLGNGPTNPAACALACKSTAGCVAWAFDSCGKRNCWLKSSVTGTSSNTCRVSAVQGNIDRDLNGGDISGSPAVLPPYATANDCSNLCRSTSGCNSWAYVQPGPNCETSNNCWLKTSNLAVNSGSFYNCRSSVSQPGLSPPSPTSPPVPTPTGGKLGYAWDARGNAGLWSTGKVSWYYTWNPTKANSNKEFVPMIWGAGHGADFLNKLNANYFAGSTAVLGFNEPERGDQANLSPALAVTLWRQYMQPLAGRFRLGAPAISSAPEGKAWLIDFLARCTGCTIDFLPLHWYGSDFNLFTQYITDMRTTFGKKIWLTEFACAEYGGPKCTQEYVYGFMGQTTAWLDQQSYVERYAWFGARVNDIPATSATLTSDGNSLTPLGGQYVNIGGHE